MVVFASREVHKKVQNAGAADKLLQLIGIMHATATVASVTIVFEMAIFMWSFFSPTLSLVNSLVACASAALALNGIGR